MEAKELRIGNIVTDNVSIQTITAADILHLSMYDNIHKCVPIPLTEEWLLNLGYIHSPSCHYVIKGHLIWKPADFLCCDKTGIILKYVHQLQNLYFALTNEELTIKQ